MSYVADHERRNLEFDWLAIDQEGAVGYFATAGGGPVPSIVATEPDLYDVVFDAVMALPVRGRAELTPAAQGNCNEWLEFARRGLWAYDYDRVSCRYELIAHPSAPLTVDDLPGALADLAGRCSLDTSFPVL